jgi:hypothetical protein
MANNRVFYACQGVAIGPTGANFGNDANVQIVHGVQSIGITTNFNLEQAFELGQIQIYENIEGTPEVEVTLEKVLDGYPLIYHLCSPTATSSTLVNRSKERSCVALGIYPDDKDAISGVATAEVVCSGMYLSAISYTLAGDGNSTESVTLVGNTKTWSLAPTFLSNPQSNDADGNTELPINFSTGAGIDAPYAGSGVSRREDVDLTNSILPASIYGTVGTAAGNAFAASDSANPQVHIQSFSCSTDLSREDIFELGRKTPYFRAPNFPVEVTSEFEVISVSGDFVDANELNDSNTNEESIKMITKNGVIIDLGVKNRLSSVSYGGGDATGGNATQTYSYTNFNDFIITRSGGVNDPASGTLQT